VNDNINLIAAAAGGLMLSVALSGILKGTPVTNWQQATHNSYPIVNVRVVSDLKCCTTTNQKVGVSQS
jgi:hypothetical protein